MKITYIHHSSFCVELDNCILLFDYYRGEIPKFDKNKKLYVFSSHSHHDHFDAKIFDFEKIYHNVTYVLSDDIKTTKSSNILFVKPNEKISISNIEIETLESTDLGVAFIVKVDGKNIYHAGDLNWWHWEGENSPKENEDAGNMYKNQIDKLNDTTFDLAFVPLDPRQGEQYYLGFNTFMENTDTKVAFPMHFWKKYSIIDKLLASDYASLYENRIIKITHENESFIID